jgi:hypothetical protein
MACVAVVLGETITSSAFTGMIEPKLGAAPSQPRAAR